MQAPWLSQLTGTTGMILLQQLWVIALVLIRAGAGKNLELVHVSSCVFFAHFELQWGNFWGPSNVDETQVLLDALQSRHLCLCLLNFGLKACLMGAVE